MLNQFKRIQSSSYSWETVGLFDPPSVRFAALLIAIACSISLIHRHHLIVLFENDRHFSHLSTLERELTFRTEMGLYYSYYKMLVEAPTIWQGLTRVIFDNITEYPNTINALQRFNLYPEVLIAIGYRLSMKLFAFLQLPTKQCWQVSRAPGLSPVLSCEGIGESVYFYVESAFLLNGILVGIFFIFGVYLSGSIIGGALAVLSFFFNHTECTRVQWSPALRESFAYPFFVLQMLVITFVLRSRNTGFGCLVFVTMTTLFFILPWQFAQFALLTQLLSLFGCHVLRLFDARKLEVITTGLLIGTLVGCALMFGNKMMVASYLVSCCIVVLLILSFERRLVEKTKDRWFLRFCEVVVLLVGTLLIKEIMSCLLQVSDDSHITDILRSKFTNFQTFHAMLYTCASEYDFLPVETLLNVTYTFLLPSTFLVVAAIIYLTFKIQPLKAISKSSQMKNISGEAERFVWQSVNHSGVLVFHVLQLFTFFVMAILIMRLKLFLVPHMCLMTSLLASPLLFQWINFPSYRYVLLSVIVAVMSYCGIQNFHDQRQMMGEFSNVEMEQLVSWIKQNTQQNAVFAGSMPTMATIKLCTGRPIVNHPHYEDASLRERTKQVYSLFSRKSKEEVWKILIDMKIDFVINEQSWCVGQSKSGCGLADIWDIEDVDNRGKSRICEELHKNSEPHFINVFHNRVYDVLRLKQNVLNDFE